MNAGDLIGLIHHTAKASGLRRNSEKPETIFGLGGHLQEGREHMKGIELILAAVLLSTIMVQAQDQTPEILSVSRVVAGAHRTETRYALAVGKWSDADDHLAVLSNEIHCYERFGLCEEAFAVYSSAGQAGAALNSLDILRWDNRELIAVDSSPTCVVITLRLDFVAKKVAKTMALKGDTNKTISCKDFKATTTFLGGEEDQIKKDIKKSK
jgi:hypothetical protein